MIGHANPRLRYVQGRHLLGLILGIVFPLGVQALLLSAAAQGTTPAMAQTTPMGKADQPVPAKAEPSDVAAGGVDQGDDDQGNDAATPMAEPSAAAPVPLTPATHGSQFALGFPETWVITHGETNPHLTATSPTGGSTITTEVSWYTQAPGAMVPTILADIREKGYTVTLYDAIALDSTTALRLWLADLPDPGLPYAFMTVIGYGDATAVLISRYETRSHDVDTLLNQIHASFRRNDASASPPEAQENHETHHP
ncbi:MAG: hypothetical protein ACHWZW_07820 [Spirulina sp.]